MKKIVGTNGLSTLWGRIKDAISTAIKTVTFDVTNMKTEVGPNDGLVPVASWDGNFYLKPWPIEGMTDSAHTQLGIGGLCNGYYGVSIGNGSNAAGWMSFALGYNTIANANYTLAIGPQSDVEAANGIGLGYMANVTADATMSVALGSNSIAIEPNTVSVGTDSLLRKITNVASGENPNDVVTKAQLDDLIAKLKAAGINI